jgi:hypothetical protein
MRGFEDALQRLRVDLVRHEVGAHVSPGLDRVIHCRALRGAEPGRVRHVISRMPLASSAVPIEPASRMTGAAQIGLPADER